MLATVSRLRKLSDTEVYRLIFGLRGFNVPPTLFRAGEAGAISIGGDGGGYPGTFPSIGCARLFGRGWYSWSEKFIFYHEVSVVSLARLGAVEHATLTAALSRLDLRKVTINKETLHG